MQAEPTLSSKKAFNKCSSSVVVDDDDDDDDKSKKGRRD